MEWGFVFAFFISVWGFDFPALPIFPVLVSGSKEKKGFAPPFLVFIGLHFFLL